MSDEVSDQMGSIDQEINQQLADGEVVLDEAADDSGQFSKEEQAKYEYDPDSDPWGDSEFRQLVMRGHAYRKPYECTLFGQTFTLALQPLTAEVYREVAKQARDGVSDEKYKEMMRQMKEMDMSEMTEEEVMNKIDLEVTFGQTGAFIEAAKRGIDPRSVNLPNQDAVRDTVNHMIGGQAIEIGAEVISLTTGLERAEEFPGGRSGN